jgi:exonuclease SbcC
MRPLALTLEGFTSYKRRQEIDFGTLDLFAICGDTGAGKTSLLDGIVFALYGKVPRLRRGYTDLIAQGLSRMAVVLSFRLGSSVYRVARRACSTKGRPASALLEEVDGDAVKVLAEGMPAVTARIEQLLGLPYEAFTQAVLLPQGQFADFLQSEPNARTKLLREILGHQIYGSMQKLAEQRRRDLEAKLEERKRTLEQDYAGATPAVLDAKRQELADAERAAASARTEAEVARKRATATADQYRQCVDLAGARADLTNLAAQDAAIRAHRKRLNAAERAQPVLPELFAAKEVQDSVEAQRRTVRDLQRAVEEAARARDRADAALEKATKDARDLTTLTGRIVALDGVKGLIKARGDKENALKRAEVRRSTAASKLAQQRADAAKLDEQLSDLRASVRAAEKTLAALGYDEEVDRRLDEAKSDAEALANLRRTAADATLEAEQADAEVATAAKAAEETAHAAAVADQAYEDAKARLRDADIALQAARREYAAADMRKTLKVGEPCPVCEQPVAVRPSRIAVPALDALEKKRATLAHQVDAADQKRRNQANEAADARTTAAKARQHATRARDKADARAKELAQAEKHLAAQLKGLTLPGRDPLEARLIAAAGAATTLRRQHSRVQTTLTAAQNNYDKALTRHQGLRESIKSLGEEEAAAGTEVRTLTKELADLTRDIRTITTHPDPAEERAELAGRVKDLETAVHTAREEAAIARTALTEKTAQHKDAQTKLTGLEERTTALRDKVMKAAAAAGFESLEAIARAQLTAKDTASIRDRIKNYDAECERLQRRVAELETLLKGAQVSEEQLRQAEGAAVHTEQQARTFAENVGGLRAQIKQLGERIERAKTLEAELGTLRGQFNLYRRLAEDLRTGGGGFQNFMLEEALTEIAAAASERLLRLTNNRYALRYAGEGTILVVDNDNAGQERGTDTLSGGETFLTSLALALELSEQVRRRHYGVSLDSLFIDEGFSTLDSASLDNAAAAIELLGRDGRMVGIITHLSDLAERLPARIDVEKHADGSRVQIRIG